MKTRTHKCYWTYELNKSILFEIWRIYLKEEAALYLDLVILPCTIFYCVFYYNSEHSSFGQLLDLWVCTEIMCWCKGNEILDEGKYLGEMKYGTCTNSKQNQFEYLASGKVFFLLPFLNLVLFPLASVKFVSEKEEEKKCWQILSWYSSLKIQNFCYSGILKYKDGPN